jgi:hypothetical protein
MSHTRRTYKFKRGDKWDGISVVFNLADQNFAGAVVSALIKDEPDGGNTVHTYSITPGTGTIGTCTVPALTIAGSVTANFPVNIPLYCDVEIEISGTFGPYTPVSFILITEPDITI